MNTLVTGGTGFVGKVLVNKLLKDGYRVTILTRDERKIDSSLRENIEILEGDINDPILLKELNSKLKNTHIIFHLAASLDYFGDKKKLFRVNVEGTVNLLNLSKRNGIKKFIYISSIEAMGTIRKDDIPANESYICKPVSTYGESKLEAEKKIMKFGEEKNFDITILRLGNVYGPGSPAFIAPIANAILSKNNLLKFLPVYKDRYLHPVYIEDVVDGIRKAAQKSDIDKTYILSGEKFVTIETLFKLIAQELNIDIDLQIKKNIKDVLYLNLRKTLHKVCKRADLLTYFMAGEGKRIHRAYSIEKAKKELGYLPKTNLSEGIKKTIEWAKEKGLLAK